jgi:hypothetical protein
MATSLWVVTTGGCVYAGSFTVRHLRAFEPMRSAQVHRPTHEYDLYLTLFITSSGGL